MSTATSALQEPTTITVRRATDQAEALVNVPASGVDLEALEKALIVFALESTHANRTRAAHFLGLTRSALLYRMHKYGLVPEQGS